MNLPQTFIATFHDEISDYLLRRPARCLARRPDGSSVRGPGRRARPYSSNRARSFTLRTFARREMARGFEVSGRRASEAPQKPLLQNHARAVRPRDRPDRRVGPEIIGRGDQIVAVAAGRDDR